MKVAIVGYGVEGESSYKYFAAQGADITIFDENKQPKFAVPGGAKLIAGPDALQQLHGYDIIMRVPSVRPERLVTDGEVSSNIREFFKACPASIIGVTGSKGKGTTASLIHAMLKNAGIKTHLAGNIGVPALDILPGVRPNDVVVLELSSFQLWDMDRSPHVAVVIMMEPEHLDVHTDIQEYLDAKANIVRWQKPADVTVYLKGNSLTEQIALQGRGKKVPYAQAPGAYVQDGVITIDGKTICRTDELILPGPHNAENACAAITAVWQHTQNTQAMAKALREFSGLDHRLKLVRQVGGVGYYDDSIATTPGSAIAAVKAFAQPKVILLGGSDKGADFTELAQLITATKTMRGVVLIGDMRHRLRDALQKAGYTGTLETFDTTATMAGIVNAAHTMAKTGDVVLLSPACASFDMFKSYQDRGEQFVAAVKNL